MLHQNRMLSKAPKIRLRINEKEKMRKLRAIRFRALAAHYYDPGTPVEAHREQLERHRLDW